MVRIYAPRSVERYIKRLLSTRFVKSGLTVKHVPNGAIVVDPAKEKCYGVFDSGGEFVTQSMQTRGKGQLIPSAGVLGDPPYFDYDAVYLGNLDNSFGHYLLESWDRAYAFLCEKYRDMKFILVNDKRLESVPQFVTELARLLGMLAENLVILDKSAKFRNVYVPESGFRLIKFSSREFGEIYAETAGNVTKNPGFDKIYVSRAMLKHRRTYGEEKVQSIFEKNGYHIVYPEQLPLEEQIALMKNCKSLAGCAGTALHLALFMPEGGNVIQIRRNKIKDGNCATQYMITETKNLDLTYIDASIEKEKTTHFEANKAQIIGVNEHMRRFFDENGFEYSPSDAEFDKVAWDEYILQFEKLKAQRREQHGGKSDFEVLVLKKFAMFMACFIPNRHRRVAFRLRMWKSWGIS